MDRPSSVLSSFGGASPSAPEQAAAVFALFIYPIKSCRGISVPRHASPPQVWFRWDRQWMVVNSKRRALTQRGQPKLALVEVELPVEAFSDGWEPNEGSFLVIRAPGMHVLKVPLKKTHDVVDGASVWEWSGSALDEGAEASEWFSNYLGIPCQLLRFNSGQPLIYPFFARHLLILFLSLTEKKCARGSQLFSWTQTMFSDGFPFLLISQGSLNALNQHLEDPLPINRFRPNILIDGCEPFSEDLWTELKISKLEFHGVKLCSRCKMTTINQENGVSGVEPIETLLKFRSDRILRPGNNPKGKVYFGQNLVCKESLSSGNGHMVKVGDPVYVFGKVSSPAHAAV
ncbi:unnamed protein product [Spirodela intermedia]|uniref:MOSC domain-containing protein n=1 Tax=Spirodela intermedia TaxID=51605 RepID=A0A7I8JES9_SPIIN|nr:unnamed protein product [Spirodela intermedia]CAA6668647.1 unnamed protein product [Spirodela intermedia]